MHLTIYTDNLPPNVGGCANGPIVRIRPKYRDDAGIHAHEYLHVEQFWIAGLAALMLIGGICRAAGWPIELCITGLAAHPLLYKLAPAYRLWAEVAAYREQLRHYPDDRTAMFAGFIAGNYGLGVSAAETLRLLKG